MKTEELILRDVINKFEVLVEEVATEICGDFCRYPEKFGYPEQFGEDEQEDLNAICKTCPLDRLRL